ncbi:MAG: hypothetical protein K0S65_6513, partial [Labilithrix sp.]|nr:hypothetical protein [Labilithrix sp.]
MNGFHRRVLPGAAIASVLASSCAFFFDESEFVGKGTTTADGGTPPTPGEAGADASSANDAEGTACPEGGVASIECLAQGIPTEGLLLWLRADDGVEVTSDGRVTAWRDSTKKLRPGSSGYDALPTAGGTPPVKKDGAV